MFTRYHGTVVPENYSGVRFRDAYAPPTEMKTHKPSPSYTSTRTSVSPMFKSAQLQRNQSSTETNEWHNTEWRDNDDTHNKTLNEYYIEQGDVRRTENENENENESTNNSLLNENIHYQQHEETPKTPCIEQNHESNSPMGAEKCETKNEHSANFGVELNELLNKIFKGIQSEDFLLLSIIFLLLGDEKSEAKGALLPLALLLLYS